MKFSYLLVMLFLPVTLLMGQSSEHTDILETILKTYYKDERAVIKGRASQYLFLFCERINNNEEIYETINYLKLPANLSRQLKSRVQSDRAAESWAADLESVVARNPKLQPKINDCLSLEEYQEKQKKSNTNNHRLMIISKPLFFPDKKTALVKIVFYRTIEHNKGSVLRMEKIDGKWTIREHLNAWET